MAWSGTRSPGGRLISLRRLRQLPTIALSFAIQASACGVDLLQLRLRIGRGDDAVLDVVDLAAGDGRDPLPQLGGDEGRDRMHQAQHRLEHAQQRAPGGALRRLGARLELHLGDLEVPVAVLVPDEGVDRLGDRVEPVLGEARATAASTRCSSPVIQRSAGEKLR